VGLAVIGVAGPAAKATRLQDLSEIGPLGSWGCVRMKEYKIYCLDHEARNVEAQTITASTDEEAVRQAKALKGLRQCEVWAGHHLVAKITDFEHSS
jgi:hypothetical protein